MEYHDYESTENLFKKLVFAGKFYKILIISNFKYVKAKFDA